MPATGVRAPARMLVAVRAMAPVAGSPPKSGEAMLAMPWAISSTFGLWRSPPHAIRDHRRQQRLDRAEQRHGQRRPEAASGSARAGTRGMARWGSPDGMPPKRLPTVSTPAPSSITAAVPPTSARMAPGHARREAAQHDHQRQRRSAEGERRRRPTCRRAAPAPPCASTNSDGTCGELQPEEVPELRARDEHRDAVGEPDDDRPRQVLHRARPSR